MAPAVEFETPRWVQRGVFFDGALPAFCAVLGLQQSEG
ncbi:hypothetical protein RBY4I_2881 [Rhodobacterales bacterium Y4I]|nr:hypothetical protein RBY4I_2881 [Rhodobacterales bacterium Y4I]